MKIGDFAKLGRVSIKALRYYDTFGLLRPDQIQWRTGYRSYSPDQLPRLNRILALKDLGFSLDEIKRLLNDELPALRLREMLRSRREEIARQIQTNQATLDQVEARLTLIEREGALPRYEVLLKEVPPTWIAAVKGSFSTYEEAASTFAGLFQALAAFLRKQGVRSTGPAMALYQETEGPEGIPVEAALPLASSLPSRGEVSVRLLEGVERMASVVHRGTLSNLSEAYTDLFRWVEANGCPVAGSPRDLYLEFRPGGNPERFTTEIQLPVARKRKEIKRMEPKILRKESFKAVGMKYLGKNENNEISQLWDRFVPRIPEIRHLSAAMGEASFGLCYTLVDPSEPGEFSYIAALPVDQLADIPEGMVGVEVPAQTYAVAESHGLGEIGQTYDFLIKKWLPTSPYEAGKGPDFELYPMEFISEDPHSTFYIYYPIVPKASAS